MDNLLAGWISGGQRNRMNRWVGWEVIKAIIQVLAMRLNYRPIKCS